MKSWFLLFWMMLMIWVAYKVGYIDGRAITKLQEHKIFSEGIQEGLAVYHRVKKE